MWRTLRLAWQPAFQGSSLQGYTELMNRCSTKLGERLGAAAAEEEAVDILRELGNMTMDVSEDRSLLQALHGAVILQLPG